MSARLELEVACPLPSLANARELHFVRSARVTTVHQLVHDALAKQPVKPFELQPGSSQVLVVRLTRLAPAQLDDDNLASAMKAARDAVAQWLGVDDREHLRVRYFVYQAKRPKVVLPKTGRQRKDRVYQTLHIEAFTVAVPPPLGADLQQLKLNAEVAAMLFEVASSAAKVVKTAGDVEAALGAWLGIDATEVTQRSTHPEE